MKNLLKTLLGLGTLSLAACGAGTSTTTPAANNGIYNLQGYKLTVNAEENCQTNVSNSNINCDSGTTFAGDYTVTFSTPSASPGAYLLLPRGPESGITIAPASGGCPQTPPATGANYTCNFTVAANGTAVNGASIPLQVTNNTLGSQTVIIVNANQ